MNRTDYLVATNSFLSGMAKVVDFSANTLYSRINTSENENTADYRAIRNDWYMIGNDIKESYEQQKAEENIR